MSRTVKVVTCQVKMVECGNVYFDPDIKQKYAIDKDGDKDCKWTDGVILRSLLGPKYVSREQYIKHFVARKVKDD